MQTLTLNPSLSGTRFRRAASAASAKPVPASAPAQATTSAVGIDASSLDSAALLQGRPAVEIAHNGFVYRLQATRLGKLILTK